MAGWQQSPFAGATIDFSQIGNLADRYYAARDDALKRQKLEADMAYQNQQRGRASQQDAAMKQFAAEGLPKDAQGNIDYQAAADKVFRLTGNFDQANKVLEFGANQKKLNQPATTGDITEYQFYANQERDAGRSPVSAMDFWRQRRASANQDASNTPQARAAYAAQYGLDPNSDAGRAYVLTGRLPREDQQSLTATDKKAILEADEMVAANKAVMEALNKATELSPKSYDGAFASQRAWAANNLVPWKTPEAENTTNLDNAVVGQALTQLKTIFGGNPTEGERKILLDLQGSANMPEPVRREIFKRAYSAAEARLKFNEERAASLRGGTFYKPAGAQRTAPSGAPAAPATPEQPGSAPGGGPRPGDIEDGYRFRGGNPSDPNSWERAQ